MRSVHRKRKIAGMTLIEVLMASAVFAIISTAVIAGLAQLQKGQRRVRAMTREDRLVSGIMNNIRDNLHLYQAALVPSDTTEDGALLTDKLLAKLPIAFSDSVFIEAEKCPGCPGRLGFVLQPLPGMPNMFKVTLKVKHKELYGDTTKEFRFVASFK